MPDGIEPSLAFLIRIIAWRAGDRSPFYIPHGRYEVHIALINILKQSLDLAIALLQRLGCPLDKVIGESLIVSERVLPFPQHQSREKLGFK